MAKSICCGFANRTSLPYDFFYDEALYRLVYVAQKYDESRGPFGAYFAKCLRGYLLNLIRDHARPIRAPRYVSDLYLRHRKLRGEMTTTEAAEKLGVSPEDVDYMLGFYAAKHDAFIVDYSLRSSLPPERVLHITDFEEQMIECKRDELAERLARCLLKLYESLKDT